MKAQCHAIYQYHSNPNSKVQQTLMVEGDTVHNLQAFTISEATFIGLDKAYCILFKDRIVLPLDHDSEWLKLVVEEWLDTFLSMGVALLLRMRPRRRLLIGRGNHSSHSSTRSTLLESNA